MLRWVSGLAVLGVLACSSSTTNESGSGGSSTGGSSTGGSSTGGSSGSSTGGSAGTGPKCTWDDCKLAAQGPACSTAYNACGGGAQCVAEVAAYVGCACGGGADACPLPKGVLPAALINCLAKDPVISPKCFGVDCRPKDQPCSVAGFGMHCCGDLTCLTGTCK